MDSDDEYLINPGTSIKTHRSDAEDEVAVEPEEATSNTVMLFEENVKLEAISSEVAGEDPLNILNKLEIKVEPTEIRVEFKGEYNESDFLNTDSTVAEIVTDAVCPGRSKNKRMRTSASELRSHKSSVWSNTKPTSADITEDILKQPLAPKGKGPARLVANILEAWHLLIDEPIMANILKYTNEEMKRRKNKTSGTSSLQRSTDLLELRAWIGLNYLSGVFRVGGGSLEELWTPELGNGIFRACMSLKRFEYINDCLRLSETPKKTTKKSPGVGALHDVAGVWEKFIINCRSYYAPSSNCTLEEHVLDMTNTDYPESIKHCLTDNPERSGIRLISLHDSKTRYMCNAVIGLSAAPIREEVLVLVSDIKGTKRNVTLSQRYTSLELANNLQQCQLTSVGSLATNSKDFPAELTTVKGRQTTRRLYAGSASLIVAENNNQDVLLTSGISDKINAEKLYEVTVISGKKYFESSAISSTESAVVNNSTEYRWTLRFFHAMLDFACLNAWLLFRLSQHGNADIQQRDFQRQLGLFLTQQHLKRRLQRNSKIPLQLKLLISEILGESPDALIAEAVSAAAQASSAGAMPLDRSSIPSHIQLLSKTTPKRNRCRVCPSKNNIKTRWQCQQCGRALCLSHLVMRCDECTGLKKEQPEKNGEKDEFFK